MTTRVLIVEDSEFNMEIASIILQRMGYSVIEAVTGSLGYQTAVDEKPDLILLDYHLPGMNGIEVARNIRNTPDISHIPIIAMTADIYAEKDLMDAGCNAYLSKPIRKTSLLRTINQVLTVQES